MADCTETVKRIEERIGSNSKHIATNTSRLNNHSDRLKLLEEGQIELRHGLSRLDEIMTELKKAVEGLTLAVQNLEIKPLKGYEKLAYFVLTAVISFILGLAFKQLGG